MSKFLLKTEHKSVNTTQTLFPNTHTQAHQQTSFIVNVVEILREEGICRVKSDSLPDNAKVFYTPESGVREGGAAIVQVSHGVPIITRALDTGTKNKALIDPLSEFFNGEFYRLKEPTASDSGDYQSLVHESSGVVHDDSEKVFACDFSGLKAGLISSVMFYEANSKFISTYGQATVAADSISLVSYGGLLGFTEPSGGEKSGYVGMSSVDIDEEDDQVVIENTVEYRGNVSKALSDASIEIQGITGNPKSSIYDSVYALIVFGDDIDDFKVETKSASHTYIHRELKVIGGGGSDERVVHNRLAAEAGINDDSMNYRCIVARVGGEVTPIVYMKYITRNGDVYEFNAGEKILFSEEEKSINVKEKTVIELGFTRTLFQTDHFFNQYPTSESTSFYTEIYGTKIDELKGDHYVHEYRYLNNLYINSSTIYEIDESSSIKTFEYVDSPIKSTANSILFEEFTGNSDIGVSKPVKSAIYSDDSGNTAEESVMVGSGTEFMYSATNGKYTSIVYNGSSGFVSINDGYDVIQSKILTVDSDFSYFSGTTSMNSLIVDGDIYVSAKNIVFRAKESLYIGGRFVSGESDMFSFTFNDNFVVSYSGVDIETDKQSPILFMSSDTAYIAAEQAVVYGGDTIYGFADNFAAFGADKSIFFGSQT